MTRIIQRCFVVLAFTGILLSTAQETTVSEVSDSTSQSNETPTSAPDTAENCRNCSFILFDTEGLTSSLKNGSTTEIAAAESSSHSTADVVQTSNKVSTTSFPESNADGVTKMSGSTTGYVHDITEEKTLHNASRSDSFKAELNDDSSVTEETIPRSDSSDNIENASSRTDTKEKKQSDNVSKTKAERDKLTTEAAMKQSDFATSSGRVSTDSGQSSVPSEEELVYNSSLDKNQSPEDMTSSAPRTVQNEESENNDTKSSTHKRSLNATNSTVSSTTVMSSNEASSENSDSTYLSRDSSSSKLPEREDEQYHSTILSSTQESIYKPNVNHAVVENRETLGTVHDVSKAKMASSSFSINSDNSDDVTILSNGGPIPRVRSRFGVPKSSSSADLKDASQIPFYSDALTLNEESIQPSEIFDSAAQIANIRHTSTMSSIPLKSPDLEVEYEESASHLNSPASPVTFDPDGMTHNSSQEPDSITFSPKVVHGKPTNSFLSNLEKEEMHSTKPELSPDNLSTTFVTEVVGSSSHNIENSHYSEREREMPSASHGLLPHDVPDREIPTSMHTYSNNKGSEDIHPASEPQTVRKSNTALPINEEVEEMLNDSPHFAQNQSKPTIMPLSGFTNNYSNKDLENNISNDITLASGAKSQDLHESHHELDFPIEYQTQQSEIRPVTAVSPIKASDTVTDFPISLAIQSQSPPKETESDHLVSTPNDMSSAVIFPNPAPSIVNKSLERIVIDLSSEMLPIDYIPPELLPKDYVTPKTISTDHISAEILPKDYVPPDMLPKDYAPSEKPVSDPIKPETLPKDSILPELLPKEYVPPEMLPKDKATSEKPSKDLVKPEILPKDYISPELLPKDYAPPEMLPKDYADDQIERGNNTDTNVNTTIAGVAVKTSVSVSLPISKSPNSTTGTSEHSVKGLSNMPLSNNDVTPVSISVNKDADGQLPSAISTEIPTPPTTESTGFRIRKPKIKINSGDDEPASPRTRKPFLVPPPKPSSTAGPPVSIFRQARTRMASITSSTTHRPIPQFSTIRIHYASRIPGMVPGGEMVFSIEPVTTTTVATTTETEEPFSDEPFTGQTVGPVVPTEDNVTLLKVAGMIVVDKGLRWNELLNNRLSPQYKEREKFVQSQLYRLFRTSVIAPQLWKIQIDGFSGKRNSRSVVIDFFLYLIKTQNEITPQHLVTVFHDKLINNTFSRFTVDTNKTTFEFLNEELMRTTTPLPEEEHEPVIPQWAIAVIVVGAASLIFIVLFAAVAILGRHHVRRRYSNKLNDEDSDRPSDWESKMAAAYENLAADTIYDAEDFHSDTYKKRHLNSTYHGRPSRPRRADSWSSSDWSPPPRRPRPQVHRIVY